MATAAIYRGLCDELGVPALGTPPVVHASLIEASVRIAMSTDTLDMGLMGMRDKRNREAAGSPTVEAYLDSDG
jgi:hypothetical protein